MTHDIGSLFASNVHRRIEEVIKVDQTDEAILRDEIHEYVVTDAISKHFARVYEAYADTPNHPHEGTAVWVSGFFGSGKSSFAKILGLTVDNRSISGATASALFLEQATDSKVKALLHTINEKIPTHTVIFDVSTDRGIRSSTQTLTQIMYQLFLKSLGYASELDLAELEIALESDGRLDTFKQTYQQQYKRAWDDRKAMVAFAFSEASAVMHTLDPSTYPARDSWAKSAQNRADISPGKLAQRATDLMKRHKPGHVLVFVIDEVGQFVARDVQKMLDLQAVVQNLGKTRGKQWVVVTSQERLGDIVSGLDEKKVELSRLMDRFPTQVHLEPSDISTVTSRRVLSKNAAAQATLGKLFDEHHRRLDEFTRLSATITLPELSRQGFVDLYPLLPYQIDLIIQIVSGLRTQGSENKHVGGANRTIIKLAQQLLIHSSVNLASQPVGQLVRLDHVYDLVEGNIASEVRAKINDIPKKLPSDPLAQPVAKVICLLQFVKAVSRTAENIAACLLDRVDADSPLARVRESLARLEQAHFVLQGTGQQYRIPTPAEDDWERARNGVSPRLGDAHRLLVETLESFWQPQPDHLLLAAKTFQAGLTVHGRAIVQGDVTFHLELCDDKAQFQHKSTELRARSQTEKSTVFWAIQLDQDIDQETTELYRSREILTKRERDAKGPDERGLVVEERARRERHQQELKRRLSEACLTGQAFFRGNDRSPPQGATSVAASVEEILEKVLPDVYTRFAEAAAKTSDIKKAHDALLNAHDLKGLPDLFTRLSLLKSAKGKTVFDDSRTPLAEVMGRIEKHASYGKPTSGKQLVSELEVEPFGWESDMVRLLTLCLLRAERIEVLSGDQRITSATSQEAKALFGHGPNFKQATFRPRQTVDFALVLEASEHFQAVFGETVKELTAGNVAAELRKMLQQHLDDVQKQLVVLQTEKLPGASLLEQGVAAIRSILRGSDDDAITTFRSSFRVIDDAIKRAAELEKTLVPIQLTNLRNAHQARSVAWAFLRDENDLDPSLITRAEQLKELLDRETFFRELASIDQHARALQADYDRRYEQAVNDRVSAYSKALAKLAETPGWTDLAEEDQRRIAMPLSLMAVAPGDPIPIPQLRSEREAWSSRLHTARDEVLRKVEGERIATVSVRKYFRQGIETPDQLESVLTAIREDCAGLLAAGKKIILQ